jgi:chemotaxis family two-component system response regulator PixG
MIAEKLEQILQPAGFRVLKINNPMQGVAKLAEEKPDLIFLDVVMPQTSGYNVCSFLRQSSLFRDTPIIILTSQNGLMDRTKAKLNGASDFLCKPPEAHQVLEIVKKYLQESAPENLPVSSPAMA